GRGGGSRPPSSPEYRRTSAGLDQEVGAPVLGPARLALLGAQRSLLAVADDRDAVRLDALRHEVVHRGLRASLAERQIVLVRAAREGLEAEDEPGAPAAGAGADRPAPDAAVVAGRIAQPATITPSSRSDITAR